MALKANQAIAAGARRHLVEVQRVAEGKGTSGEPTEDFETYCRLWAHLETVDAPERFTEGMVMDQMSARAWIKFTVPYRSDLDPLRVTVPKERRIKYLGRIYDIAAASLVGFNKGVELLTLSKVG